MSTLLCGLASISVSAPSSAQEPDAATQVGYARIDRLHAYTWDIECTTTDELYDFAIGFTAEHLDGSTEYFDREFWVWSRTGRSGRVAQIDSVALIDEPATGDRGPVPAWFMRRSGYAGDATTVRGHLAWAAWGGRVSCAVTANGRTVPVNEPPGARAVWVGPQGFRGGVFAQEGSIRASAGRAHHVATGGGLVLATLWTGYEVDEGAIVMDDPVDLQPEPCQYYWCMSMRMHASNVVASLTAAVEIHDGAPSAELYVIDIPEIDVA